MIDAMLYMGLETDTWHLDLNIIDGGVELVPAPQDIVTNQQRKAVLAYQALESIPGDWERGVDWANIFNGQQMLLADAMMDVQQALGQDEGTSANKAFTVPIIQVLEDGPSVQLLTVSTDDIQSIMKAGK